MAYYLKRGAGLPDLAQNEALREGLTELTDKKCLYFRAILPPRSSAILWS